MYALISVYDDTNKSICKSKVLLPDSVETTEYSDETYTEHKFSFTVTTSKTYQTMINGKFKHDDIPEPEANKWMDQEVENGRRAADDFVNKLVRPLNHCIICKKVMYDDKAICDKCYEIAKKEGLMI